MLPIARALLGPVVIVMAVLALRIHGTFQEPLSGRVLPPAGPDAIVVASGDALHGPLLGENAALAEVYSQGSDGAVSSMLSLAPDAGPLFLTRWLVASIVVALLLPLALQPRRAMALARAFLDAREPAINLAVFRVVVFGLPCLLRLTSPEFFLQSYLYLPAELTQVRFTWLPDPRWVGEDLCLALQQVYLACSALAAVGLFTRFTAPAATLLAIYVLGIPALLHGGLLNHLVWFAGLLSVSRCADTLSLDARLGLAGPDLGPGPVYGTPLRLAGLLMASIFMMPGFWKLWLCGMEWGTVENLRNHMYFYWQMMNKVPVVRVDLWPWLFASSALVVPFLQLCDVALALTSPLRVTGAFALCGLLTGITAYIIPLFWNLIVCLTVEADWSWLGRIFARGRADVTEPAPQSVPRAPIWMAGALLFGNLWCGVAFAQRTWLCTMYPSFGNLAAPARTQLVVERQDGDPAGERLFVPYERRFNSARWAMFLRQLAAMPEAKRNRALHETVASLLAPRSGSMRPAGRPEARLTTGFEPRAGSRLNVLLELVWVAPERRLWPPLRRLPLGTVSSDVVPAAVR